MKVKKKIAMLSALAMVAIMIPLSAYAAASKQADSRDQIKMEYLHPQREGHRAKGKMKEQLLTLLKLDESAFKEKLKQGKTIAQIAEEQGISRDQLKKTMISSYNEALDEQKQNYANHLDQWIDSKVEPSKAWGGRKVFKLDLSGVSKELGMTDADLKKALEEGKTLADLARDKGVNVQKLIDIQLSQLLKKADEQLSAGKITKEQYEQRKAKLTEMLTNMANGKFEEKEHFRMKHHHSHTGE